MTDAQQAIAQVREALAAGPTPGPWHHDSDPIKNDPLHRVRFRVTAKGRTITETYYSSAQPGAPFTSGEADNRFIAACSPANMTAILDHVEAQEAEIERLRAALNTCVWALRQPLDDWKGECERKALDEARDALKEQR